MLTATEEPSGPVQSPLVPVPLKLAVSRSILKDVSVLSLTVPVIVTELQTTLPLPSSPVNVQSPTCVPVTLAPTLRLVHGSLPLAVSQRRGEAEALAGMTNAAKAAKAAIAIQAGMFILAIENTFLP